MLNKSDEKNENIFYGLKRIEEHGCIVSNMSKRCLFR